MLLHFRTFPRSSSGASTRPIPALSPGRRRRWSLGIPCRRPPTLVQSFEWPPLGAAAGQPTAGSSAECPPPGCGGCLLQCRRIAESTQHLAAGLKHRARRPLGTPPPRPRRLVGPLRCLPFPVLGQQVPASPPPLPPPVSYNLTI